MLFEYETRVFVNTAKDNWHSVVNFVHCCDWAKDAQGSWCDHAKPLFFDPAAATAEIGREPDEYFGGWNSSLTIKYCPNCGQPVASKEISRVEVTATDVRDVQLVKNTIYTERTIPCESMPKT